MRFHVLTIFPDMFEGPFSEGIVRRGIDKGLIELYLHDVRDHTHDRHRSTDDYTFGGGPGMLMKPEPLFEGVEVIREKYETSDDAPVILLTPQGERLDQPIVEELVGVTDLILICGRYEGVDERVRQYLVTHEVSVGDYVLSGGEVAAMVLIDTVSRLLPGVVGSIESTQDDTFTTRLLQYPQYTRPADFRGMTVPDVLLSGNHAEIKRWRRQESLRRTFERRPDLLDKTQLSDGDQSFLDSLKP